ncbi:MAG: LytTR family transcriptional regulator DNA-binding domain-containing protein [Cetobacterium sp.]|nr:LytTR family transcriptional regulator DNA-binding domain-containing protein [Cetobacterium sp.]
MIKIRVDIEEKLKILLEETLEYKFIEKEELEEEIFLIDISRENLLEKIKDSAKKNIPVIVLLGKENIREMRKLLKLEYIEDCVLRQDIFELEESIEKILQNKKNYKEFYLNDTYQRGIVEISEVIYITYCRVSRKTEIHLFTDKIFTVKSSFSEVEEKIIKIKDFYKLDRGTIINISLIRSLDYKEERIIFKDETYIYTSKAKLKELEEKRLLSFGKIIL